MIADRLVDQLLVRLDRRHPALGLFLIALMPTSGMTISWTGFAKGNMQVAIKMTIIGLVFPSIATLAVMGIVFVAMALKAKSIISNPQTVLGMIVPLILFYVINFVLTSVVGRSLAPLGRSLAAPVELPDPLCRRRRLCRAGCAPQPDRLAVL